ncbi:unnamed protein product [Sphenostylis stenocarpa]|uniref:Uncharacterized protein n=1 Tax=Sphenostylis stenocarpa TaxID=92480 RepID=A0AA86RKH4_9FABA|nr:unnamed protein product [Sphenostylis stenocarpa]
MGNPVTPSNDAQIAPLHRLSFRMSILLKLAQVSDVLALLQPIRRLQDLHLNLHRFPLKTKHYLRLLELEQEWNGRKLSLSSPPTVLCLGELYEHLDDKMEDLHLGEDGGFVVSDDDII